MLFLQTITSKRINFWLAYLNICAPNTPTSSNKSKVISLSIKLAPLLLVTKNWETDCPFTNSTKRNSSSMTADKLFPHRELSPVCYITCTQRTLALVRRWAWLNNYYAQRRNKDKLAKTSTAHVLQMLINWVNLLGWPETIWTDGGPQFGSEFVDFCNNFFVIHELSSLYHPESNDLVEAAIKNKKNLLKKCTVTGQHFQRCLSVFRNMPLSDGPSPASVLFMLPQKTDILLPPWPVQLANKHAALQKCAGKEPLVSAFIQN